MASSGLNGPYDLTKDSINKVVTKTSAGAYALGKVDGAGTFLISYIGRSDSDLNNRLQQHVGKYTKFKCDYFGSPKAAFDKECNLYHDFTPPDNKIHPDRPQNSGWKCQKCNIFN